MSVNANCYRRWILVRKLFIALLCIALLSSVMAYAAPADWLDYTKPVPDQRPLLAGSQLTVGTSTAMSGYFATDLWGVNTADLDVRALLHGYETVVWSEDMPLLNGTVIKHVSVRDMPRGGCVFILEIDSGLTYNDGTPITAQDYVFSLLLEASSAVEALGGACRDLGYIQGYHAYHSGERDILSGVYLISPESFAIEIIGDALDNFYGPELLAVTPYPISVIAPGFSVHDEGEGVFLAVGEVRSGLTTELLQRTMLDPISGYAYYPWVSSGPYRLVDSDVKEGRAVFTINHKFAGDAWGFLPVIETLQLVRVDEKDAAAKLAADEIGLMNKVINPGVVAQFRALPDATEVTYSRTGLAYLAFEAKSGPSSDPDVRKAVAMAIDCDALVAGNPGLERVYGYYGFGQWMVMESDPEALRALGIPYHVSSANALLDTTAWVLDANGNPYESGGGTIRYRERDGVLEPLTLTLARSAESGISGDVIFMLNNGFDKIGVKLQVEDLSFNDLLAQYYHQMARTADLYFLASDFPDAFYPPSSRETGELGYIDAAFPDDEVLAAHASAMLSAGYGNQEAYLDAWFAYQSRFMELVPVIPLYSGMYHDFHIPGLIHYEVAVKGSWAQAIVAAGLLD